MTGYRLGRGVCLGVGFRIGVCVSNVGLSVGLRVGAGVSLAVGLGVGMGVWGSISVKSDANRASDKLSAVHCTLASKLHIDRLSSNSVPGAHFIIVDTSSPS